MHLRIRTHVITLSAWWVSVFRHGLSAIFDAGWPMAVWQRIEAFQHVSLKVIAEALLPAPMR